MPHAEESPIVNGETPSSLFLSHLSSYPVVSDSISAYKSNRYGAASLSYADSGYAHLVKPLLPYARQPYGLVAPWVEPAASRADELAAAGLDRVDHTFPIVTKDAAAMRDAAIDAALFPVRKADETRTYVFNTFGQEYKRAGDGPIAAGRALFSTGLVVSADFLSALHDLLAAKKAQGEALIKEKTQK